MAHHKLRNYIRSARRRHGLSQAELSYLLGCGSSQQISRYEHFRRTPPFRKLLALHFLFGMPADALFAGEWDGVAQGVRLRAAHLFKQLQQQPVSPRRAVVLRFLRSIGDERNRRQSP